jgi:hypothetical protein
MPINPPIAGTPAEIYEQHMVPAIFVRWTPDLVEATDTASFGSWSRVHTRPSMRQTSWAEIGAGHTMGWSGGGCWGAAQTVLETLSRLSEI